MPIYPKEIQKMIDEIKPWLDGAGYKDGTPPEIIEMDEYVTKWTAEVMDGVQ